MQYRCRYFAAAYYAKTEHNSGDWASIRHSQELDEGGKDGQPRGTQIVQMVIYGFPP
jgi:hypothetical protein